MPNKILHKRNSTSGVAPQTSSLDVGEIAINTADGAVYTKKFDGSIDRLNSLKGLIKGKDGSTVVKGDVNGNLLVDYDFTGSAKAFSQNPLLIYTSTTGNDVSGIGTIDKPYASLQKSITIINGSGIIKATPGSYFGSLGITSSNIQIDGEGVGGKNLVTIQGKVSTSGGVTRLGLKNLNITNGSGLTLELSDYSGRHVFENVAFQCTGATVVTTGSSYLNWLTFNSCDFTSSAGVVSLPNLTGTASATFYNCSGAQVSVGTGWTVTFLNCFLTTVQNNGGTVYINNCPNINSSVVSGNTIFLDTMPAVRYDTAFQGLNTTQKTNARTNLGLGSASLNNSSDFVLSSQKGQPNGVAGLDSTGKVPTAQLPDVNVGVASFNGATGTVVYNGVRYDSQTLTSGQKTQAKTNLDLDQVENYSAANLPVSTATQNAINAVWSIGDFKTSAISSDHSKWLLCDGSAKSRSTYSGLFLALCPSIGTATITIASPAVITLNSHGLIAGSKISFETTGSLPTGISVGTNYYVSSTNLTANTFQISTTDGGASVNTSGTQSGTHTIRKTSFGCGNGSTTFNLPDPSGRAIGVSGSGAGLTPRALGSSIGSEAHTLSTNELPAHKHLFRAKNSSGTILNSTGLQVNDIGQSGLELKTNTTCVDASGAMDNTGSGQSHNNMQPTIFIGNLFIYAGV